jgi:hypothetical protein
MKIALVMTADETFAYKTRDVVGLRSLCERAARLHLRTREPVAVYTRDGALVYVLGQPFVRAHGDTAREHPLFALLHHHHR